MGEKGKREAINFVVSDRHASDPSAPYGHRGLQIDYINLFPATE